MQLPEKIVKKIEAIEENITARREKIEHLKTEISELETRKNDVLNTEILHTIRQVTLAPEEITEYIESVRSLQPPKTK